MQSKKTRVIQIGAIKYYWPPLFVWMLVVDLIKNNKNLNKNRLYYINYIKYLYVYYIRSRIGTPRLTNS